ncbi:MAG TPA: 23S rRNA (guanosine(2251)-2'-O)-methyltransferase RlmB [Gaiellaceae bacterium]|nr:23S rRNA (guanosine(2251)-2'-O)-methyltransferase RlmB [Gaiellaceae bacterium]
MTRDLVYGRNAVRELLRGPREVFELWASERAAAQLPWLQAGPRVQVKPERTLTEAAGTRDHQGVVAWCEPFRYADAYALAATRRGAAGPGAAGEGLPAGEGAPGGGGAPLLVCLDQVTDPHNLGAVVRSAEGAGASGVVLPAHRSARVTPAVCRASAGAVEHLPVAIVPNLARYLAEVKGPSLWAYAADPEGELAYWDADLAGGVALVLGSEGRGVRPLVRRTCDALVSIPLHGLVPSLNVSVAAGVLLFEARRQRRARGEG